MSLIRELIVLLLRLLPMVDINHCRNNIKHDQSVLLTLITFHYILWEDDTVFIIILPFTLEIFDAFGKASPCQRFCSALATSTSPRRGSCTSRSQDFPWAMQGQSGWRSGWGWGRCPASQVSCCDVVVVPNDQMASSKPTSGHHPVCNVILLYIVDTPSESDFMQSFLPLNHISLFFSTPTGPKCKYVAGWCARPWKQQSSCDGTLHQLPQCLSVYP